MPAGMGNDLDGGRERPRRASTRTAGVGRCRVPDNDEPERGLHWKTAFLTRWAAGCTFVWLDDEIADADRRWVQVHHPGKALLHRVDPLAGACDDDRQSIGIVGGCRTSTSTPRTTTGQRCCTPFSTRGRFRVLEADSRPGDDLREFHSVEEAVGAGGRHLMLFVTGAGADCQAHQLRSRRVGRRVRYTC
jgi:hypothetical protein